MDDEKREVKHATNEEAQRTTRIVAVIYFAIGLVIAYFVWPSGVTEVPLSSVTVGGWLRMLASGAITLAFLYGAGLLWI